MSRNWLSRGRSQRPVREGGGSAGAAQGESARRIGVAEAQAKRTGHGRNRMSCCELGGFDGGGSGSVAPFPGLRLLDLAGELPGPSPGVAGRGFGWVSPCSTREIMGLHL